MREGQGNYTAPSAEPWGIIKESPVLIVTTKIPAYLTSFILKNTRG
jgi:hypothetical protein